MDITFTIGDRITLKDGREMTVTDLKYNDRDQITEVKTTYKKDNGTNQTNWHNADTLRERVAAALQIMFAQYQPCPECGAVDMFRVDVLPDGTISNACCLECEHTVIGGKFAPPADPTPNKDEYLRTPHPDDKPPPPDLFSLPKQPGDLSDVITPKPAPPPRRKMSRDEERNALYYLTATTSMNHNHARSLVEYFGHEVGNALTAGEGLDAAPGIGHVTGPKAASAWNRAPSWVRECLPLGIEGYPPSYIEYVMVHDLATDPDDFRDKFPLPDDEQPFAHLTALHGFSTQEIAAEIFALADYIEEWGNKGYERHEIDRLLMEKQNAEGKTYMLHSVYADATDGILFYSTRDHYNGWYVRKNPHWKDTWLERFGEVAPGIAAAIEQEREHQAAEEAAQAERELELARPHGDTYKHLNTKFVAYRAAVMDIMRARASVGVLGEAHRGHSPRRTIAQVYQDALKKLTAELAYRKQITLRPADFDDRATYRATVEDYAEAGQYLDEYNTFNGRETFFTEAYYRYATSTAAEPDLSVDFDDLPRATIPETPVRDMTTRQLSLAIMQLLTSKTEDEFTEEDKDNLLRYVRDQFPEAKNLSDSEAWANVRARLDRLNLVNRS